MEGVCALWFLLVFFLLGKTIWTFRIFPSFQKPSHQEEVSFPRISVVIPARNEEKNISRCLKSILESDYPKDLLEVIVVDDGSTDRTADLARESLGGKKESRLITIKGPPDGWTGKNFACYKGAFEAEGEILIFIDADTSVGKDFFKTVKKYICEEGFGMVSMAPREKMVGAQEKMLMPWAFFMFGLTFRIQNINNPKKKDYLANGQVMAFDEKTYREVGGHGWVKDEAFEDLAFARLFKENGLRYFFGRGELLASTRMYDNWKEMVSGFLRMAKRFFPTWRSRLSHAAVSISIGAFPLSWIIFLLGAKGGDHYLTVACLLPATIFLGLMVGMCSYFKINPIWSFFSPIGFIIWGLLVVGSGFGGKRSKWKGRLVKVVK